MENIKSPKRGRFIVLAILMIVCGVVLTLGNIGYIADVSDFWPIFPLFLGIGALLFFRMSGKIDAAIFGVGIFMILSSLLFFYLNFTGWHQMKALWPLSMLFLGIAILSSSGFTKRRRWFVVSGLFMIFLSGVFIAVFAVDARLWPISLIFFGAWLFVLPKRSSS